MAEANLWERGGLSWGELGKRVYNEIWEDDVLNGAAQLAYYFMFALFPLLIFLTSIFGFIVGANTELRDSLFKYLGAVLPGSAAELINTVIQEVTQSSSAGKLTLGLFLALWVASSGLEALAQSLNRVYGLKETRQWWKLKLMALGLTIVLALLIISSLVIILFGGHIIDSIASGYGFGDVFRTIWKIAQYLIVLAFVLLSFALIYYWSPDVHEQKWYFITPGSFIGVLLWLAVSFAFRIYLSYFDSYSATYGSIGAVIILMLWLYMTGLAILVGGEINSEIENAAAESGNPEAKAAGEKEPGGGKDELPKKEIDRMKAAGIEPEKGTRKPSENADKTATKPQTAAADDKKSADKTNAAPPQAAGFLAKVVAFGVGAAAVIVNLRKNDKKPK